MKKQRKYFRRLEKWNGNSAPWWKFELTNVHNFSMNEKRSVLQDFQVIFKEHGMHAYVRHGVERIPDVPFVSVDEKLGVNQAWERGSLGLKEVANLVGQESLVQNGTNGMATARATSFAPKSWAWDRKKG